MTASALPPQSTLAIILGASDWSAAQLDSHDAFANSANALLEYLKSPFHLDLAEANILNLFDDKRSASDQISEIARFLKRQTAALSTSQTPASDLLVFYTGHGAFHPTSNEYFLLVRATEYGLESATGFHVRHLKDCLSRYVPLIRKFIVLDCCFAGAAGAILQSDSLGIAAKQTIDSLPSTGTVLLCSSNSRVPSRIESGDEYTMFSYALRSALYEGNAAEDSPSVFSYADLRDIIWQRLRHRYADKAIYPVLLAPDQSAGDLTRQRAFPNAAKATKVARPSAPVRTIKQTALNVLKVFTISLIALVGLTFVPFSNPFKLGNTTYGDLLLREIIPTIVSALLVWILAFAFRRALGFTLRDTYLVAAVFALSATIGSLLAPFLLALTNINDSYVLQYATKGELRSLCGLSGVAVYLKLNGHIKIPLLPAITFCSSLLVLRYILYMLSAPEPLKSVVQSSAPIPVILLTLLILFTRPPNIPAYYDVVALFAPLAFYILILVGLTPILAAPNFIGELIMQDAILAPFLFVFFIVPTAWCFAAMSALRPGWYIARTGR